MLAGDLNRSGELDPNRLSRPSFHIDIEKAKEATQQIMQETINDVSHVMGRMSDYSANRKGDIRYLKPEVVYDKNDNFTV